MRQDMKRIFDAYLQIRLTRLLTHLHTARSSMHLQSISSCIVIPDFTPFTSVHHKVPPWHRQPDNPWRNSCWNPSTLAKLNAAPLGRQPSSVPGLVQLLCAMPLPSQHTRDRDKLRSQTSPWPPPHLTRYSVVSLTLQATVFAILTSILVIPETFRLEISCFLPCYKT